MGNVKIIYNEDFYNKFIECLKNGKDFEFPESISHDKLIVKENISIEHIYEEIKNKELKGATIEENDKEIIINIDINVHIVKVEFKDDFIFGSFIDGVVKNQKSVKIIFNKEVIFWNSIFNGKVDFSNATFNKVKFRDYIFMFDYTNNEYRIHEFNTRFNQNVEFKWTIFKDADFSSVVFGENGKVDFSDAVFGEEANFKKTTFKGKADFRKTKFKKTANFNEATFKDMVDFRHAKFNMDESHDGKADFSNTTFENYAQFSFVSFNKEVWFSHATFEKEADFTNSTFNGEVNFGSSTMFKGEADFSSSTFNIVKFEKLTFESIVKFTDISFNLLSLRDTIFDNIALFKKKEKEKDVGIAIFNLVNFKEPNNTTFIDFPLSKTSFLLTDVKDTTIITNAEKILSDYLLEYLEIVNENNRNKDYERVIEILKPYLRQETVLKEYRDIRISFENNRTYIEASELFIYEMDLIRRITIPNYEKFRNVVINYKIHWILTFLLVFILFPSTIILILAMFGILYLIPENTIRHLKGFLEGFAFDIYKITSNYGESITKPILISSILVLLAFPILLPNINLKDFTDPIGLYVINNIIPGALKTTILHYDELLRQTLRAFFQLGIDNDVINSTNSTIQKEQLKTLVNYEWLIRITSLILLGSLFIAIKRRLERK